MAESKHSNAFYRIVEDLDSGELSMTHIQMAVKSHYRHAKHVPEGIKDLLCGKESVQGQDCGIIHRMFKNLNITIGSLELAYRRGEQDGV